MIRLRIRKNSFIVASDAQAFTILAVLIITIALTVTGMYFAIAVPLEITKSEFNHAEAVSEDFVALQTAVHALERAKSSVATTSVTIQLTPEKTSNIVPILSSGSICFSPLQESMAVQLAGEYSSIPPPWTDDDFVNTTCSNLNLTSGDLKLAGPPPYSLKGHAVSNMTAAEGHLGKDTGSNSTRYGNLTWYTSIRPNTELVLKVRTDMFSDMSHAKNWSDCPEIQSLNGYNELNLTTLSSISHGHRYIQYRADMITYDFTETPILYNLSINFSSSPEDITLAHASGSITYMSNYYQLPNQELIYENGAVIKNQQEGGFVANPRGLRDHVMISNASGVPSINLSLVNLTGSETHPYSGAPVVSVRLFRGGYEQLISDSFYYPTLTLNITTNYPSIWKDWLNKSLHASGLVNGSDYAPPTIIDNSVRVVFYGQGQGVKLYLDKANVQVSLTT